MYVLVLFKPGSGVGHAEVNREHELFIDGLIRHNQILLGGSWSRAAGQFSAAYLLHCGSLGEAREIASGDPYVRNRVYEPEIVEWNLVGINPDAIEPGIILTSHQLSE